MQSEQSAVLLSRGGIWKPQPGEPPYLMPDIGQFWPSGTARIDFTDTSGALIATLTGTVAASAITFVGQPADLDKVPAGANFEITLTTAEGPYKIRYGKVIRKEATFSAAPPTGVVEALSFGDSFQRSALGRKWTSLYGSTVIHDNSLLSLPNGVSTDIALFTTSAIRYWQPFNTDSIRLNVNVVNPLNLQAGKTGFIICADQSFTSGLAMILETGVANNYIRMATVTRSGTSGSTALGPISVVYQGSAVSNTTGNGDNYTVSYNNSTKVLAVYKGSSLSPVASWTDSTNSVPHGPGYRYVGFSFAASLLTQGIQVTSWAAQDLV